MPTAQKNSSVEEIKRRFTASTAVILDGLPRTERQGDAGAASQAA